MNDDLLNKISFIAELGFNTGDSGIDVILRKMLEHTSDDGIIKLPMNISQDIKTYGNGQILNI